MFLKLHLIIGNSTVPNIKHKKIKWILQNVQFTMLCVYKTKTMPV